MSSPALSGEPSSDGDHHSSHNNSSNATPSVDISQADRIRFVNALKVQGASGPLDGQEAPETPQAEDETEETRDKTKRLTQFLKAQRSFVLSKLSMASAGEVGEGKPPSPKEGADSTETLFPRKTKEELQDQETTAVGTWQDSFGYIFRLVALVIGALAYSLLDIFLFNVAMHDNARLYATTIGLIGVAFDFLWKYYVAIRAFTDAVKGRGWQLFFAFLGCIIHAAAAALVRLPYYLRGASPSSDVRLAGTMYSLAIVYILDYVLMPLLISRMFWALDTSGRRSHDGTTHVGIPLYTWIVFFYTSVIVSLFESFNRSVLMDVILWAPLLILICVTVWDSRQLIRYEFKYLALYFWLVNMIPFLSASFFNFFIQAISPAGRFFLTISFIGLFHVLMMVANVLSRLFCSGHTMVHFVFPVQFFEYFFSALIFVDVDYVNNILFWFILAAQSVWLTFRNSGLFIDLFMYAYHTVLQPFVLKYEKLKMFHELSFDAARTRLYRQSRMAVQYTACDIVCLIVVPSQYHLTVSYLSGVEKEQYASFFQMTAQQSDDFVLVQRFAIIACVKLVFHILAHLLLWYKVRTYNKQGRAYDVEPISFVQVFRAYLARNWIFLLILIIYTMRACYMTFAVLLSTFGTITSSEAPGLSSLTSDRFWLIDLTVYSGLRFS